MSKLLVNQDWETDVSPGSLTGTAMARSTTNAISGTDLRWVAAAAGPTGAWQASAFAPLTLVPGSRRGLVFQAYMRVKRVATIAGAGLDIIRVNDVELYITNTTHLLTVKDNAANTTAGGTTIDTSAHTLDIDIRHERDTGIWVRVWLDGTIEINHRKDSGAAETAYTYIQLGDVVGKTAGEFIWGDFKFWYGQDPS